MITTSSKDSRRIFNTSSFRTSEMIRFFLLLFTCASATLLFAQAASEPITGWQMQDSSKVTDAAEVVSSAKFHPDHWYAATVPGTVLTTLVNNSVYPEPLYGENMRTIPESLNKTSYWYRASFDVPKSHKGLHTWLHFGGINYSAEIWVNGHRAGAMKGAFIRGDFDVTDFVKPGRSAVVAVRVSPQPHPGVPHEHTVALGVGKNGGETALDGPTFLSTIGWDWLPAIRDRDTGIWLPVTIDATGPVIVKDPFVTSNLSESHEMAELRVSATLQNLTAKPVSGTMTGVIQTLSGGAPEITFQKPVSVSANASTEISLDPQSTPELVVHNPRLWWPNGYGPQNLYTLTLKFNVGGTSSDVQTRQFGIRKIEYQVPDSENLTISVNGVRVMVRGGN